MLKHRMGWSCQKPAQQLRERDEERIKRWKTEKFDRIKSKARDRNAYLAFADETGFMLAPTRRRTLAPRGRAPLLDVTDPHGRISVIAAITFSPKRRRANLLFHLLPDNANFNGSLTAEFLRCILGRVRQPITLVWDGVSIHSATPVTSYLESHPRMLLEEFPPYASEFNPVDNVWSYIKYGRLANYTPFNLSQLRETVTKELRRVQKRQDLLHGFLRRTGLSLDD